MIGHAFRAERRVARRLIEAGAISPSTAREFGDFRWAESRRLNHLIELGMVCSTPSGLHYIDEAKWAPYYARRRKLAFVPGAVLLSTMIVVTFVHRVLWPLISEWVGRTFGSR